MAKKLIFIYRRVPCPLKK